ncbi:MAG: hypothetical protein ACFFCS_27940 [Candidatus Hodarchaeota archaeon]
MDPVPLEISRFCEKRATDDKENFIELDWADPREISLIKISINKQQFKGKNNNPPNLIEKIQYWKSTWPEHRPRKEGSGQSGWNMQDDWYKGTWREADFNQEIQDSETGIYVNCTFNPLNRVEFPDENYPVTFRRTLKLRVYIDKKFSNVKKNDGIQVFTNSKCEPFQFSVAVNPDLPTKIENFKISIFNGYISSNGKPIDEIALDNLQFTAPVMVHSCLEQEDTSFDGTLVKVEIPTIKPFTFAVNDLKNNGKIFIPDLDVLVHESELKMDYKTVWEEWNSSEQNRTVYDRIFNMPEQTFDQSMNEFEGKELMNYILGYEGVRAKCAATLCGNFFVSNRWLKKVHGPDSDRCFWDKLFLKIGYNFLVDDDWIGPEILKKPESRSLRDGYLPIISTRWQIKDGVYLTQEAYATLIFRAVPGKRPKADEGVVVMSKLTFENASAETKSIDLYFSISEYDGITDTDMRPPLMDKVNLSNLTGPGNTLVEFSNENGQSYRCLIRKPSKAFLEIEEGVHISFSLEPNSKQEILFKLPLLSVEYSADAKLARLDFEKEKFRVGLYWYDRVSEMTSIEVPNDEFNLFYKSHLIHVLITNDRENDTDRVFGRVGSLNYGTYANEVCMITMNLDKQGMFDEARRILDIFLAYQGTKGLYGDYEEMDGILFGARGYECGESYNQHHGFVLWAIAEHVRLSGDIGWLKKKASKIVKACDWITIEREGLKKKNKNDPSLEKQPVYNGLLPAGGLEDLGDFWYWLSTNAYNGYGLAQIASLLSLIHHKDAARIEDAARDYIEAIRLTFDTAMESAPVVQLNDVSFQPFFPCRALRRGRGFGWIQETLEGAMHLIRCWIVSPFSREATWILKDYEDNLFLSDQYGYPVIGDDFERYWFNRGGFSMQPYLLCNHYPYAVRGETKHYIRAVMNSFAVNYRKDTKSMCEHPLPGMLDVRGDFWKTSDEANFSSCFRDMLVQEINSKMELELYDLDYNIPGESTKEILKEMDFRGGWSEMDSLRILYHTPREWFENSKEIHVSRLPTYFGLLGIDIESRIAEGSVHFTISLDVDNVKAINPALKYLFFKFRHPNVDSTISSMNLRITQNGREILIDPKHFSNFTAQHFYLELSEDFYSKGSFELEGSIQFSNK